MFEMFNLLTVTMLLSNVALYGTRVDMHNYIKHEACGNTKLPLYIDGFSALIQMLHMKI